VRKLPVQPDSFEVDLHVVDQDFHPIFHRLSKFPPIIRVDVADPTGAGDAYRAGFLTAYDSGYDPLTACRIGTTAASFVVERVGCQTNLPDWSRMKARYETAFGKLDEIT